MTQDEIIRMAQGYEPTFTWQQLQAAVLAEREACAKLFADEDCLFEGKHIAAAIRARSKHG